MEYLNRFDLNKIKLKSRAINFTHSNKLFFYGPPKSGKTSMALNIAKRYKKILYIDLQIYVNVQRANILINDEVRNSQDFKSVELVIIDNFNRDFNIDSYNNIDIILIGNISELNKDFLAICINMLSFKEYLIFEIKNNQSLSNFIRDGNKPGLISLNELSKKQYKVDSLRLYLGEDFQIFMHLLNFQAQKISILSFYNYLKNILSISKDKLYKLIHDLRANRLIYFCEYGDCLESKSIKSKIYFYDFSLYSLNYKNFKIIFENMVYLELIAHGFNLKYNYRFDFFDIDKNMAFICMPFAAMPLIKTKLSLLNNNRFKIFIISMNLNYKEKYYEVIDFNNFCSLISTNY